MIVKNVPEPGRGSSEEQRQPRELGDTQMPAGTRGTRAVEP